MDSSTPCFLFPFKTTFIGTFVYVILSQTSWGNSLRKQSQNWDSQYFKIGFESGRPATCRDSLREEEAPEALAAECPRQSVKTELLSEPMLWVLLLDRFACRKFFFSPPLFGFEPRWRNHFAMTLLKKKKEVRQDSTPELYILFSVCACNSYWQWWQLCRCMQKKIDSF